MATITWTQTPTLKAMTLPSGNTYWLKDDEVRQWIGTGTSSGAEYRISTLESDVQKLSNATHWLGITTTAISDGSTTNPITIGGNSVTAVSGDIVSYNDAEFIFNGTAWQELGVSIGALKAFAYVDTGTVTITPAGSNSSSSVTFSGGTTDSVLGADTTFTNSTSAVSFSGGTDDTVLGADTTFTNSSSAVTFSGGTNDSVLGADTTFTNGSSSVSFSGQTDGKLVKTTVPNVTSAGTAASWSATVTDEVLTFAWTANTPATLGTAIGVATGAIDANGTGDTVVTAVGTGTAAAQTITVGTNDKVTAITDIGTGTAAAQTITVGSNDEVTAITGVGTATAAAQTITVGSNDEVTAVTNIGTGTAAAQTFTGTEATHTVYPTSSV